MLFTGFFEKAQTCSTVSVAYMWSLLALAVVLAGLGVYVWLRFIKSGSVRASRGRSGFEKTDALLLMSSTKLVP